LGSALTAGTGVEVYARSVFMTPMNRPPAPSVPGQAVADGLTNQSISEPAYCPKRLKTLAPMSTKSRVTPSFG